MENIHIIDNFLDEEELQIVKETIKQKKWEFGHVSIENSLPFWSINLIEEEYFIDIKNIIEKTFSTEFNIKRIYVNGQTYGQNGSYHIDDDDPNGATGCLYINDIQDDNIENVGGEFVVKIPNKKYKLSIEPLNNRFLFFPANYLHKGNAFNRFNDSLRICITWKLQFKTTNIFMPKRLIAH